MKELLSSEVLMMLQRYQPPSKLLDAAKRSTALIWQERP
jgi:hypothetical protein